MSETVLWQLGGFSGMLSLLAAGSAIGAIPFVIRFYRTEAERHPQRTRTCAAAMAVGAMASVLVLLQVEAVNAWYGRLLGEIAPLLRVAS